MMNLINAFNKIAYTVLCTLLNTSFWPSRINYYSVTYPIDGQWKAR